jgi:cell division protein ZapD
MPVYEQPLNERIRTLLRLNFLFEQVQYDLSGNSQWDSRAAIASLLDILNIVSRVDIKSELLKELERQATTLSRLEDNPNIDSSMLNNILDDIDTHIDRLHNMNGKLGQVLSEDELLNSIKQRLVMPGGTCHFDLPAYHFWLQQNPETRTRQLVQWLNEFDAVQSATSLLLNLIRHSSRATREIAQNGFYQSSLDSSSPYQLIRVAIPDGSPCFAEISGGKHRFTVRFLEMPDFKQRPKQISTDIEFQLTCCTL